ncbi:lysylphosphatidylglycerol synthase transmembrane domain-containing protein [Yeosuana sp. MJ-SS3]|uniref:Lysylphosphatidylglycerol synthase transmembrane domain-containing protein n=1 Tax=Gilvirhabdus luticola TaxID=3079858 RepID=A0ABU3U3C8_9FLAO|nr:lysylphosphatidylglycerol synthase transmembrane domain-containing protein [Yeosuana sp. MJ-SS3]MDU8884834.1 lysylphosphatidylglycerol synthase transmembrane domain-containing protein [Yeosuana sp. MJ-SS3]
MKKGHSKIVKLLFPILLAVFFGWYTFTKISVEDIVPYFKNANYWWISLGIFLGFLSHLSRAYRWQFMLSPMGYSIKYPNSIMAVFIAYFANYGIPRSGEVLRAAVATNYEKVPFEKSFGTIVGERIADLVVMGLIILTTLFFQFDFIFNLLSENFNPTKIIVGITLVLVVIVLFIFYVRKAESKFANKIKAFVKGLIEGVTSIFKMKQKWAFIFHTLFIWLMYVLMFYITTFAVPELHDIPFIAVVIAFISASFTIAATNGGIFFYPLAVYAAFSLFGLEKEPSIAFGWIIWTSQTIMIIFCGILSFVFLPIYNRTK